jgi:hypothetical protein
MNTEQEQVINELKNGKNVMMLGSAGTGKCHGFDTPILMFSGDIKMVQDIKVGDLVMGDDSTARKILSLSSGIDTMYSVKNVKGEEYTVNSEHILSLTNSNKKIYRDRPERKSYIIKWFNNKTVKYDTKTFSYKNKNKEEIHEEVKKYFKNIKEESKVDIPIKKYIEIASGIGRSFVGYKVPVEFPRLDLDLDPYMVGFWLGNSTAKTSGITSQDSTVLHYFKHNAGKYDCYLQYCDNYSYRVNHLLDKKPYDHKGKNYFLNMLRKYNLLNNKHIPKDYKCNSKENRLKLLAGLIDSDGYLDKGNTYEFIQGPKHERLIDDIIFLCRSLGFACYKNEKNTSWTSKGVKKYGKAWRINISGEGIENIPVLCPRKKASPRKQIKNVLVSGITVTEKEKDIYYGFETDGNHRYVLGNFIVTHNSSLIEGLKDTFPELNIFLTSTTGVSALNIGGSTVHSFFGVGLGDKDELQLLRKILRNTETKNRLKMNNMLVVIDEISMFPSDLLSKLDFILRTLRKNVSAFGGVQMLFSGDFMQLETINAENILDNKLIKNFEIIELKKNYRQESDKVFQNLLNNLRIGELTDDDIKLLKSKKSTPASKNTVRMFCTNSKVTKYNIEKFDSLPGTPITFNAKFSGSSKSHIEDIKKQFIAKNIDILVLKINARVMLTWNINVEAGLVNGSVGTVKGFTVEGLPIVLFDLFGEIIVEPQNWQITDNLDCKILCKATQIPLIIAYSFTIHKSQGVTLAKAVLDLNGAFCNNQVYTGLSRVKSLDGLTLLNFSTDKVKVNKKTIEFYKNLK